MPVPVRRCGAAVVTAISLALSALPVGAVTLSNIDAEFTSKYDTDRLAFAYYDYREIRGELGEYTNVEKGSLSFFDESLSGISDTDGFDWVAGTGWVSTGTTVRFRWKNLRFPDYTKNFDQMITVSQKTQLWAPVVTTDKGTDKVTGVSLKRRSEAAEGKDLNGDGDKRDFVYHIKAKIKPQPNDVFVQFNTTGSVIQQAWVLDQCSPIPLPATGPLLLAALGLGGAGFRRKQKRGSAA